MTNTKSEFHNENIKVHVERFPGAKVKLEIIATPKAVEAAYAQAMKNINKEVSVPGFRKGRAPDAMILQKFAKQVDQEWRDVVLNTAFKEALHLIRSSPYRQESIKKPNVKEISKENGATFTIEYEESPILPKIEPKEITLKQIHPEPITEKQIDETIENLRLRYADWKEITDRPVQIGDFVDLDIDAVDKDNPEQLQNICKDTRMEVAEGKMAKWMRHLVIGKNAQETVEGLSEDEREKPHCTECETGAHGHHHTEELPPFVPTQCKITIKSIKNAIPANDEELGKKVGVKSLEELREKVKVQLTAQATTRARQLLRRELEKHLKEKYPFEVPASLTEKEKRMRLRDKIDELKAIKTTAEEIEARKKEMETEISKEVDGIYRLLFINNMITHQHQLDVSQEEVQKELMHQLFMVPEEERLFNEETPKEDVYSRIHSHLIYIKALDYLIDHATMTE